MAEQYLGQLFPVTSEGNKAQRWGGGDFREDAGLVGGKGRWNSDSELSTILCFENSIRQPHKHLLSNY